MDAVRFDRWTALVGKRGTRRAFTAFVAGVSFGRGSARGQECLPVGAACSDSDLWCCGDLFCVNGACQRMVGPGEICAYDAECSPSQSSSYVCEANGAWHGQPVCCGYAGAGCSHDFQCCGVLTCVDGACGAAAVAIYGGLPCAGDIDCGDPANGLICEDNGVYADGPLHCCLPPGGWCLDHAHCCGSAFCIDGYCG